MADRRLIASAIADSRLGVFEDIISSQFDDIDLSPVMCYLTDIVAESALPWLAAQLDVDGFKGYDRCDTVDKKRELIKNAINLHRHIGTVWGVKKACSIIGLEPKNIEENVPLIPGGPPVWCAFRIEIEPDNLNNFDALALSRLKTFIGYYKNARSILTEIYIVIMHEDKIFSTPENERDTLTFTGGDFNDDFNDDFSIE